uniref:Transcription elongation factor n=1 Tax=Globodera pallida TaxID=36090 RepID=A0A183BKB1_GLOPA
MDDSVELIGALEDMRVNIDLLTKTRIGAVLNEFRKKIKDEKLAKRCKALIKRWKSLLDEKLSMRSKSPDERHSSQEKSTTPPSASHTDSSNKQHQQQQTTTADHQMLQQQHQNNRVLPPSSNGIAATVGRGNMDIIRVKSVQMLANAFSSGGMPDGSSDATDVAGRVEKKMFDHHKGTGDKYKAALRSRVFNLRDKKNQALRENVLTGAVSAEKFAVMTAEEMASEEMKKVREQLTKETILEHQMSVQEGTPTDMFKCHKCGSNSCTYSQMQTRSADEPMTTFVFCRSCGNRWKFC